MNWIKSTFCGGGECVEVAWIRSTFCDTGTCVEVAWVRSKVCDTNSCVEVAQLPDEFHIRDSKDPNGPYLSFTTDEWTAFVKGVRAGDFPE